MGMCLWSPALDTVGNSVKGGEFCKKLVNYYSFHRYEYELILAGALKSFKHYCNEIGNINKLKFLIDLKATPVKRKYKSSIPR